jgi:hypothetical protein
MNLYEDHGLKPGSQVIRLSATLEDGRKYTSLHLYSTGASFSADELKKRPDFKQEYVAWDGVERVSCYNGD